MGAKRFWNGFRAGVLGTVVMSIVMIAGTLTGISPMPKPIPVAILAMQVLWLPFLGWSPFGTAVTPKIAEATLVLHLVYGGMVGWLIDRVARRAQHSIDHDSMRVHGAR